MNLPSAYAISVKYGRLHPDIIAEFSKATHGVPDVQPDISHPDHFLADKLQDEDDPRHEIVRRDLAIRNNPMDIYSQKLQNDADRKIGIHMEGKIVPLTSAHEDGSKIHAQKLSGTNGTLYRIGWKPHNRAIHLEGHFTPEEFQQFLHDYESPQTLEDFE